MKGDMKKYYRRKQAGRFPRWKREKGVWWMLSYPTIRLVLPCTNFFKYWLSVAPSRIALPSVNGSHLLWEVINPQKKDTPQSATDGHRGGIQKTGGECYTSCSRAPCVIKQDQISAEPMSLLTLFVLFWFSFLILFLLRPFLQLIIYSWITIRLIKIFITNCLINRKQQTIRS